MLPNIDCYPLIFSDSTYAYCSENGLNFSASAAAYSEDDADFTPGRRGKASRVSILQHDGVCYTHSPCTNSIIHTVILSSISLWCTTSIWNSAAAIIYIFNFFILCRKVILSLKIFSPVYCISQIVLFSFKIWDII